MQDKYDVKGELEGIQDKLSHGKLLDIGEGSFKIAEINGRDFIQTPDGEFLEHVVMEEKYFVENWLAQFALGWVGDKCYFDFNAWGKMTIGHTRGVIIVDEDGQYVLDIPKFSQAMLPAEAKAVLDQCATNAGVANLIPDESEKTRLINTLAEQAKMISEIAEGQDPLDITKIIPTEYFARHGLNNLVMYDTILIRDRYGVKNDDDVARIEKILTQWTTERKASKEDKAFIVEITKGDFIFDTEEDMVEQVSSNIVEDDTDFDPLAS
ncbi:hypothetical protein D9_0150 [Aeromonas phage D9]|uniref:Uncharacterized protein n=1 Tax=Aeromonas phage D6 TaxID=2593322 RepID=A0A514TW07_9CAUD|nr:hypothetical protein PQC08_gp223 [Aeromonas phage D6]QDJ97212.1 hypothetical protein D6_0052 [Aeromonas phage D6]QEP52357.1 hypothetical protein D9_0150 [Aeromonas phage D9]